MVIKTQSKSDMVFLALFHVQNDKQLFHYASNSSVYGPAVFSPEGRYKFTLTTPRDAENKINLKGIMQRLSGELIILFIPKLNKGTHKEGLKPNVF